MLFTTNARLICYAMLLGLFVADTVNADRRSYVWTYEYQTMPKGEAELEYYLTTKVPDVGNYGNKNSWEHQIEFEYGLTDRWDVSMYQRWQHSNTASSQSFDYAGTKLRTRYRIGEKGMYPLDTLLYGEYIIPNSENSPDVVEGKIILAKDYDKFNLAYNQIVKVAISRMSKAEHEYAAGLSYEFNPSWKVGLESTGNLSEDKFYLGPTASWAGKRFWVAIGAVAGLNEQSDDLRVRLIAGFPF